MKEDLKEIIGVLNIVTNLAIFENYSNDFLDKINAYRKDLNDLYNGMPDN